MANEFGQAAHSLAQLGWPTSSRITPGVRIASLAISRIPECPTSEGPWASAGRESRATGVHRSAPPGTLAFVRGLVLAILATLAVAACGGTAGGTPASPRPLASPSPSSSGPSTDPSLKCLSKPVPGHPLALVLAIGETASGLAVMDIADPTHPVQVCQLNNASRGRFIAAMKIAFWTTQFLGVVDLVTSSVNWSRAFVDSPSNVAFSPDGSKWAYVVGDETSGQTTHLVVAGKDQTILTRTPIGGHGGLPYGPVDQLQFSAHGDYLLTYNAFGEKGGQPNFMVFAMDGSVALQSPSAKFGVWDKAGNRLYFLAPTVAGDIRGQVRSWDPGGTPVVRSGVLTSLFWPAISPDGRVLVYNSYDAKGLPHLWRLDIASRLSAQISKSISTAPVFVAQGLVWSNEEKPCACGLGGASAPDGKVVAHDIQGGSDTPVGDFNGFTPSQAPTRDILDIWLG